MLNEYLTDVSFTADNKTEVYGLEREKALWASLVEAVVGPSTPPSSKVQSNTEDDAIYAPMSGTSRRKFNNVTELLNDFDFKADNFTIPSSDDRGDVACLDMASLYSRRPK